MSREDQRNKAAAHGTGGRNSASTSPESNIPTPEKIIGFIVAVLAFLGLVLPMTFWWRFGISIASALLVADLCLRSEWAQERIKDPVGRVFLSLGSAVLIVTVLCNPLRKQYAEEHPLPSLVYITGAPLGDDNAPVWAMSFKHFGPNSAYNCHGEFGQVQQYGTESYFHAHNPSVPPYQFRFMEADPAGDLGNFEWLPPDPNYQSYSIGISCKDGRFIENWVVARIDGNFRTKLEIVRSPSWLKENPGLERDVFRCEDSFVVEQPHFPPTFLTDPLSFYYPYRQSNHRYSPGVVIKVPPPGTVPPPEPSLDEKRQASLFVIDGDPNNRPCWFLINTSSKHLGDVELPLAFSDEELVIIVFGALILGIPLYVFFALWLMGVSLLQ